MNIYLTIIITSVISSFVGWFVAQLQEKKRNKLIEDFGTIVIDNSDDIPHLFLELNRPVECLEMYEGAKFKVVKKNYVPQK